MRERIEQRKFTRVDGEMVELEDFRARWLGREPERTWTGWAVWFPDAAPVDIRSRIRDEFVQRQVDALLCVKPSGVWLMGGFWWLERALRELEAAPAGG